MLITVTIEEQASPELSTALGRLLPQLDPEVDVKPNLLPEMLSTPCCTFFAARDQDGSVVGFVTLVAAPTITGIRGWAEDLVVDSSARRKGVASALLGALFREACARGVTYVDAMSDDHREGTNNLCMRVGFETRQTNNYRYTNHMRRND